MTTTHPLALSLAAELIGSEPTCTFCEIDGTVFRAAPYAWDLALPQHAAHRAAFDELVAALAQEEADRLAAEEAARLEALANPPPAPIPTSVSPRQMRLWLVRNGHSVAAINAMLPPSLDDETRIEWEYATEILRTNPLVQMFASQLGINLDTFFAEAATL